jgi:hypothetical protein
MTRRYRFATFFITALASLFICPPGWAQQAEITFSVIGDVPYSESELNTLSLHVANHNLYSPSEFLVHVGDMVGSNEPCFEARYDAVAAILTGLAVPAYIVPGDNEWNDCSDPDQGWSWWMEHLYALETAYCGTPATQRQTVRPENFAFVSKGVLFVGINLVGSTVLDTAAWNLRMQQDADWISQQLQANASAIRSAVVFAHAGSATSRRTFFDLFIPIAAAFAKPLLYVHGDGHSWRWDLPFSGAQNVRRMEVERGTTPPVQLTVTLDPLNPFVFNRTPWPAGSVALNRSPCVDAGADIVLTSGTSTSLDGFVTDDRDPPGTLTTLWTTIAGPGTVTFQNPSIPTTSAQFSVGGAYTLRLTANDGSLVSSDDLSVVVGTAAGCTTSASCNDGLYCNGVETCVAGSCQAGSPVNCGDGIACTNDSCNETTDSCTHAPSNAACNDGFYCNGTETCSATLGCQAGVAVNCADAVACTTDACNESTDTCTHTPNNAACSDGLYCTGAETCSATLGCQAAPPVNCNDGAACTADSCDETADRCSNAPNDGLCADAEACTTDTCVVAIGCQHVNTCSSGEITFVEARSGSSLKSNTVATAAALTGVPSHLYLATVSYKPNTVVTGVTGLGLAWTRVGAQCAGRSQTGLEVWKAQGTPSASGVVTATLSASVSSAVIIVTRYAGVHVTAPIGSIESANTRGVDGACSGGTDTAAYSYTLFPVTPGSFVYSAVAGRGKTHTPGVGYQERAEILGGSGGNASSAADSDRTVTSGTTATVNGSFSGVTDWAALAVEVRPAPPSGCNENLDCNDGQFCNGVETCVASACQTGVSPTCGDGVACTADSCNEGTDGCDHVPNDAACDNGLFCDGAEICDPGLGCQFGPDPCPGEECHEAIASCSECLVHADCNDGLACNGQETCVAGTCQPGTSTDCDDGVACTIDACTEPGGTCSHTPSDAACGDGVFCNGAETCEATLGCQAAAPVDCTDGFACTADGCNESTDSCDHVPNDASCDNGTFCDGAELCDPSLGCQSGPGPCSGQQCDEASATCLQCLVDAHCNDGLACNGQETCVAGTCQPGTATACDDGVACTIDACTEPGGSCSHTPSDAACGDGVFCNGAETCNATLGCQAAGTVDCTDGFACTADGCNEATDSCDHVPNDAPCDNGLFCDGAEICDPGLGCQPGPDPCPGEHCDAGSASCVDCLLDADCNDGLACTGLESCVAGTCQPGTSTECNDGVACTVDACNEPLGTCSHAPSDAACGDGAFCNGTETCNATLGCQAATPVDCSDGIACTTDFCNESTDSCSHAANDGLCVDANACTADTCVVGSGCQHVDTCTPAQVTFAESRTGTSISSNSVTTASAVSAAANQFYLAAVSYKPNAVVTAVSGLGLTWTRVGAQCAGRSQTGIEVWRAQGAPSGNGLVTATMSTTVSSAVIAVTGYTGVDAVAPIASAESANTLGVDGLCSGGVDSASYSYTLSPVAPGMLVYSAAAMRGKLHTPGAGYQERAEVVASSGGSASSAAASDKVAAAGTSATVNGTFSGTTDWAALAVALRPASSVP